MALLARGKSRQGRDPRGVPERDLPRASAGAIAIHGVGEARAASTSASPPNELTPARGGAARGPDHRARTRTRPTAIPSARASAATWCSTRMLEQGTHRRRDAYEAARRRAARRARRRWPTRTSRAATSSTALRRELAERYADDDARERRACASTRRSTCSSSASPSARCARGSSSSRSDYPKLRREDGAAPGRARRARPADRRDARARRRPRLPARSQFDRGTQARRQPGSAVQAVRVRWRRSSRARRPPRLHAGQLARRRAARA